ncbi:hypothetical protein GCM10009800_21430 [Nocardiopsis rhodophaea]
MSLAVGWDLASLAGVTVQALAASAVAQGDPGQAARALGRARPATAVGAPPPEALAEVVACPVVGARLPPAVAPRHEAARAEAPGDPAPHREEA